MTGSRAVVVSICTDRTRAHGGASCSGFVCTGGMLRPWNPLVFKREGTVGIGSVYAGVVGTWERSVVCVVVKVPWGSSSSSYCSSPPCTTASGVEVSIHKIGIVGQGLPFVGWSLP